MATASRGCSRPGAWTLREAGNGPVVTRSSSTFGMSFAGESGAESGIVDLRCACGTKTREHLRRGGRLSPRCSCPYAGTTRIRFEGLPRPILTGRRRLSPLAGHPLDKAIIRRVFPVRQEYGSASRSYGDGGENEFEV